jgi:hypothetical protein
MLEVLGEVGHSSACRVVGGKRVAVVHGTADVMALPTTVPSRGDKGSIVVANKG